LAGFWPIWVNGVTGLNLGFLGFYTIISIKFMIDREPSCPTMEFWDFNWIGEQATGADDHEFLTQKDPYAKTFRMSPKNTYMYS
jgi:hypothetical protein